MRGKKFWIEIAIGAAVLAFTAWLVLPMFLKAQTERVIRGPLWELILGRDDNYHLDYAPDGNIVALGTRIGVFVFDLNESTVCPMLTINRNEFADRFVSLSKKGNRIAIGYLYGFVQVFEIPSGECIFEHREVGENVGISRFLLSSCGKFLIVEFSDKISKIWNIDTLEVFNAIGFVPPKVNGEYGQENNIGSMLNSNHLEFNEVVLESNDLERGEVVWNYRKQDNTTGRVVWEIPNWYRSRQLFRRVFLSNDSRTAFTVQKDSISYYDITSGRLKETIPALTDPLIYWSHFFQQNVVYFDEWNRSFMINFQKPELLYGSVDEPVVGIPIEYPCTAIAMSSDERCFVIRDINGDVRIWDVEKLKTCDVIFENSVANSVLQFESGNRILIIGISGGAVLFDMSNKIVIKMFRLPDSVKMIDHLNKENEDYSVNQSTIRVAAFSPDGKTMVSTTVLVCDGCISSRIYEQQLRIWNVQSGLNSRTIPCPDTIHQLIFDPSGRFLIGYSNDSYVFYIWDIRSGEIVQHFDFIIELKMSRDGRYLATKSGEQVARIYDFQKLIDPKNRMFDGTVVIK